jgi:Glycosyltransferase family 87
VTSVKQRVLIVFSIVVIVAIQISLFFAMQRFQSRKPDFASLYQAGRDLIHERFPELVSHFPALNGEEYIVETPSGPFPPDKMHPPFEMAIYAILALAKFRIAYPLWWGCNLVLLLATLLLLRRHLPHLQQQYPLLLMLVAMFFPVLVALVQGQNSIPLLFLLTLTYDLLERQREVGAGFALSMGMFKFVLVLPILLWLILERRWKSLAGFFAGCGCLFLLAAWLVGISGIEGYARMVAGYGKAAPEKPGTESIMPNLRGLFHAIGAGFTPEVLLLAATLTASLALLIWVDSRQASHAELSRRFSTQVLLAALVSYHLYPHDAAVLVLPWLLFLNSAFDPARGRRSHSRVIFSSLFVYLIPFFAPLQLAMPLIGIASVMLLVLLRSTPAVREMQTVTR